MQAALETVLIVGPRNCGKSFLLNPVELTFKVITSPATAQNAWVGIDECEVTYVIPVFA